MSGRIKVEIRQLPHGEGLALPAYQSADAAGLDLLAAVPAEAPLILAPGMHAMVPTGLAIDRKNRILYVVNSGNNSISKTKLPARTGD